ncbi:hypothetical protein [Saccharibacillus endophyticus]|uniref:Uncharacterized protein n=1 Tax=Saccharibacillus endophyticus TaxID=2060666 RepID=A0ABQ1ZZ29_9BACL|nr:hypothetical protein [Saccharibacillus endophyticus]GGH80506.1 hypothetical protein GCM10007362_28920 [Saccharibacillus endophyticus]
MEYNKTTRAVLAFSALAILIFIPLRVEIGYPAIYYTVIALIGIRVGFLLINDKKNEERFFKSWARKKSWPKLLVVLTEALKSLVLLLLIVIFGQVVVNGTDFAGLVNGMALGARIAIAAMLVAFSVILGFVNLYEKNRKYDRLYAQFHP